MTIIREPMINKDWWTKRFVSKKEFIGLDNKAHKAVYVENEWVEEKLLNWWEAGDRLIRICSEPEIIYTHYDHLF